MSRWDYGVVEFCPGCGSRDLVYRHGLEEHECGACKRRWDITVTFEADEPEAAP